MNDSCVIPRRVDPPGRVPPLRSAVPERAATDVLREHWRFFGALWQSPSDVGAVAPSSRFLAAAMLQDLDLGSAHTVVEFGPGTGSFTRLILQRIGPQTRFFALELNPLCVRELRNRFPRLTVYEASAQAVSVYLARHGRQQADYIISGLPWATIRRHEQDRIMAATLAAMAPGAVFTTFGYLHSLWLPNAVRLRRLLHRHFARVEIRALVWLNLPPALVYRCQMTERPATHRPPPPLLRRRP